MDSDAGSSQQAARRLQMRNVQHLAVELDRARAGLDAHLKAEREGAVLFNPGGPGASGIDYVLIGWKQLRGRGDFRRADGVRLIGALGGNEVPTANEARDALAADVHAAHGGRTAEELEAQEDRRAADDLTVEELKSTPVAAELAARAERLAWLAPLAAMTR